MNAGQKRAFSIAWLAISFAMFACSLLQGQESPGIRHVPQAIPNRYIVVLKDTVSRSQAAKTALDLALKHTGQLQFVYLDAFRGFAVRMPESEANALAQNPLVALVEEDAQVTGGTTQTNPDWGLDRIDQRARPLNSQYTYTLTGAGVHVYVIDSGINVTHTDFGGRASVAYDVIGDGQNGIDCHGHGTHVAGTIGGTTYGVAKQVSLYAVRVLDCSNHGTVSGFISGVDWVISHAIHPAVANMSLVLFPAGTKSSSLDSAVASLINSGVTTVICAGNDNVDASTESPSDVSQAIVVGATDSSDARASFSNFGSVLDTFAPGVGIISDWIGSNTATNVQDGTSMAAPHVTGVVATYLQTSPSASPVTVAAVIAQNATSGVVSNPGIGSPNRLLYSGNGTENTFYLDSTGHTHQLSSTGNGWSDADLTAAISAPVASSGTGLTNVLDSSTSFVHVYYLGTNQHVYELYGSGATWHSNDITSLSGAPVAVSGSALTSIIANGSVIHVFYRGTNQHVYELYGSGTTWHSDDASSLSGAPVAASGSALTSFIDNTVIHVFYLGTNQNVYELYWTTAWHSDNPTSLGSAPVAVSGSALTSFVDNSNGGDVMHVFYFGTNQHVYELYWTGGSSWHSDDPTSLAAAPVAASGSKMTSFLGAGSGMHVFYLGTNAHVYELHWTSGTIWNSFDATAAAGIAAAAAGSSLTTFKDLMGGARVYFLGTTSHVYELYWYDSTILSGTDLTTASASSTTAASGSALTSLVSP